MCKIDDFIDVTSRYIAELLDLRADIRPVEKDVLHTFPANITAGYTFCTANLLGHDVVLLYSADSSAYTPGQMRKQKELVERKAQCPVIFVLRTVAAYNVRRLVRHRVNFIIPQKQMFIPDLLIDLKPHKNNIGGGEETQIPAIAQCIILYHLEVKSLEGKGTYDIADLFNVSYANVNRAVRWLKDKEVIALSGGKTKSMIFQFKKRELWDRMLPFLANPIERIVYTYAIAKEEVRRLQIRTDKEYGETRIEIWRYNPCFFSKNGIVDKLSLFLAMKDMDDERIQIELETMINNMIW